MALNAHHTFEDINGIKCSIVEKNCTIRRAEFLKNLLEFNGFTVVMVTTQAQKPPTTSSSNDANETTQENNPAEPSTYTVAVTDLSFNPINGVYNRQLKNQSGRYVTPRYWNQHDDVSHDDVWYWKQR